MPGKNHGEIRNTGSFFDNWILPYSYYALTSYTVFCQSVALYRYFYIQADEWKYSTTCYVMHVLILIYDIGVFWPLTKVKFMDPGYLFPTEQEKKNLADAKIDNPEMTCMKCGIVKSHELIHHCSRCGRCCDSMDHHCYYTDNCVGKKNLRYFTQFIGWSLFSLFTAVMILFTLFYWQNTQTGLGIQGIGEVILKFNAPYQVYAQFRLLLNLNWIPECWNSPQCIKECQFWLVDAVLFLSAASLFFAVMITWTQVWSNLKNQTSFPKIYKDEMKAKKKKKAEEELKKKQAADKAAQGEKTEETKEIKEKQPAKEEKEEEKEEEKKELTDLEVIVKIFGNDPTFWEVVLPIPLRRDLAKKES